MVIEGFGWLYSQAPEQKSSSKLELAGLVMMTHTSANLK